MPEFDRQFGHCPDLLKLSSSCGVDTLRWDGGVPLCWREGTCEALLIDRVSIPERLPALAILLSQAYPDVAGRGLEERGGW